MSVSTDPKIIEDIIGRGVENVVSNADALRELLQSGQQLNCYLGIDPTATRIHLGHAFNLRKLQKMAELGHNVTFLIGSFTALVGDTSDKNDERPILTRGDIEENQKNFQKLASTFLNFDNVNVVYNHEWLSKLTFAEIIDLTKHFSVNDFTSRELIRNRLDEGKRVGLLETLYPLMQGYDSYHLDTDIQFGATDQTFNMQAGRALQKKLRDKESFVVASGYLPGTDGRKMSKSWGNAIWLDDEPQDVFGKVMRIADDVIKDYLVLGTNLDQATIDEKLEKLKTENPMEIKKFLARTIVKELHGEPAVEAAEQHFVSTVQEKSAGHDATTIKVTNTHLSGHELLQLLVDNSVVASKNEGRRLFESGSIHLGEASLTVKSDIDASTQPEIRVGKRRYIKLEV